MFKSISINHAIWVTALVALVHSSWGADLDRTSPFEPREVAKVPEYCRYTQEYRWHVRGGNDPDQIARWQRLMGPSSNANVPMFEHMHHYCSAMYLTNQAVFGMSANSDASSYLKKSIDEFDYVIDRSPDTFVLLPEILTRKGENLIRLARAPTRMARPQLVEQTLGRAIGLKRDYWPAYAALSDYYKDSGNVAKARETLISGIAAAPGAKALKRRLAELQKRNG